MNDATAFEQINGMDSKDISAFLKFVDAKKDLTPEFAKRLLSIRALKKVFQGYIVNKEEIDSEAIGELRLTLNARNERIIKLRLKKEKGL